MGILTVYGEISEEFSVDSLSNLCIDVGGIQTGPFGSQLHKKDYVEIGTPIITVEHLGDNRIIHENLPQVSDIDKERLKKYQLKVGDIVFSRVGSVDRRALVRNMEEGWLFSGRCLRVRPNPSVLDPIYLSYFLGLSGFKEYVNKIAVGATMPSLNTKILSDLPIYFPSLPEQRAIAEMLGSLDDKIEANRRENETLEATARAIFKSWFVDFEPVHAKSRGEIPAGMDEETARLFPDAFVESELGLIPQGWEVKPIGDAIKAVGGSTPSTSKPEFWDDGTIHWATPKDLSKLSSPVLLDTDRQITELGLKQISSGLLPKGTLLLSSRAPVGYLAIAEIPVAINQGFIAMICDDNFPNLYALFWAEANLDVIKNRASGTTFQEISKSNFRSIIALTPSLTILCKFVDIIQPIYKQIIRNLEEIATLTETRDALLPKLMSGEVRLE